MTSTEILAQLASGKTIRVGQEVSVKLRTWIEDSDQKFRQIVPTRTVESLAKKGLIEYEDGSEFPGGIGLRNVGKSFKLANRKRP